MPAEWKYNRRTGIVKLDDINRNFLKKVNDFIRDCQKGICRENLPEFFKYMEKYVNEHLLFEEKIMKEYGYLKLISHAGMHTLFKGSFLNIKKQYEAEGSSSRLLIALVHLMTSWIVSHLNRADIELADYLRSMALSRSLR